MFLLALAAATGGVALRVVEPMLPRLADEFGRSVPATAIVITAFGVAQAIAQYFHGPLGDRYGKLRMATILASLASLAALGTAYAWSLESMAGWRFVLGLVGTGTMTLGMAYVADVTPAAERQPVLARFVSGTIIGQALGPFVGGALTDIAGWRATFIVLGVAFASVAAILFARTRGQWNAGPRASGPVLSPANHLAVLASPRARAVLAAVTLEMVIFFGAFAFLGAHLKARFDLSYTMIGLILAGFGAGGLLYTLFAHRLLAALGGQRGCMLAGGIIVAIAYAIAVLASAWPPVILATIGTGFGFYLVHNTLQMKATEMAPARRGTAISLFSMCWGGGQALGAALMGALAAHFDYAPLIGAFGVLFLGFALLVRAHLARL